MPIVSSSTWKGINSSMRGNTDIVLSDTRLTFLYLLLRLETNPWRSIAPDISKTFNKVCYASVLNTFPSYRIHLNCANGSSFYLSDHFFDTCFFGTSLCLCTHTSLNNLIGFTHIKNVFGCDSIALIAPSTHRFRAN